MTRINTNIPAFTAIRSLNQNGNLLSNSLQRLSTGFRITRGADDPAGLVVSERLRSQIATLRKAVSNNERAQNLLRTAEGSITEINSLLLSMVDLATEAANTGALSAEEIQANQNQIDAAIQAIDRIANTASSGPSTSWTGRWPTRFPGSPLRPWTRPTSSASRSPMGRARWPSASRSPTTPSGA